MNSVSARLLAIWPVCVAAVTLEPFNFAARAGLGHGLEVFEYGAHGGPIHFVLNMLLFMPFGVLLHHEARRRSFTLLSIVIVAGMAGISISMIIEYLQAFLPGRDSSLIDVLANAAGALVGVAAERRWGTSARVRLGRVRAGTSTAILVGLVGSCLVAALLISGALQAETRLSNWNSEYPLLIGNELTGDRPWRGRVFALDITDASTPAASVRRFSAGESVALPGSPVAMFAFTGNPPYKDAAGILPDFQWTERPNLAGQAGVRLSDHSWLKSDRPAAGFAQRLRQTNAFTLHVRLATDDPNQDGPARIVSNSASPLLRNFTLGQQGSDLVVRWRTPATGVNGYPLEVHVPGVFADSGTHEILATYNGASLLVATAHGHYVSSTELTPGATVALAFPPLQVRPDELRACEMVYVAFMSLVPAALIGLLGHTGRQRLALSVAWVLAFAVLLEITIVGVSGRSFDWPNVAQAVAVGALVLAALNALLSRTDTAWPESAYAHIARVDALEIQPG